MEPVLHSFLLTPGFHCSEIAQVEVGLSTQQEMRLHIGSLYTEPLVSARSCLSLYFLKGLSSPSHLSPSSASYPIPASCPLHTLISFSGTKATFKTTAYFADLLSLSLPLVLLLQDCFSPADKKRSVRPNVVFAKAV